MGNFKCHFGRKERRGRCADWRLLLSDCSDRQQKRWLWVRWDCLVQCSCTAPRCRLLEAMKKNRLAFISLRSPSLVFDSFYFITYLCLNEEKKNTLFQLPKKFALQFTLLFFLIIIYISIYVCFNSESYPSGTLSLLSMDVFVCLFWRCIVEENTGQNDSLAVRCISSLLQCLSFFFFFFYDDYLVFFFFFAFVFLSLLFFSMLLWETVNSCIIHWTTEDGTHYVYLKLVSWCNKRRSSVVYLTVTLKASLDACMRFRLLLMVQSADRCLRL